MFSSLRQSSLGILMACLLAACAVGPDFQRPAAPGGGDSYTPAPMPAETVSAPGLGGQAQRFVPGQDIPAQWWSLFQSPALDRLVRDALARSPGLASAQAALRQADENYRALSGSLLYPEVGASWA